MTENGANDATARGRVRRDFLKKAAVVSGVVWVAPVIASKPAFAAGSVTPPTSPPPPRPARLIVGTPPAPVGCGSAVIVPTDTPNTYTFYNTASPNGGFLVVSIDAVGGAVATISPPLPYRALNNPAITITTTGPVTEFDVVVTC